MYIYSNYVITPHYSSIKNNSHQYDSSVDINNFDILASAPNIQDLRILVIVYF